LFSADRTSPRQHQRRKTGGRQNPTVVSHPSGQPRPSTTSRRNSLLIPASTPTKTPLTPFTRQQAMASPTTMKAVVFDGPHKVSVQDRPIPKRETSHPLPTSPEPNPMSSTPLPPPRQETAASRPLSTTLIPTQKTCADAKTVGITPTTVQDPTDVIVKVNTTALCGSYVSLSPPLPLAISACPSPPHPNLDPLPTPISPSPSQDHPSPSSKPPYPRARQHVSP